MITKGSDQSQDPLVRPEATLAQREAFHLLKEMPQEDRGFVLCWFCPVCYRYIPPGGGCCSLEE